MTDRDTENGCGTEDPALEWYHLALEKGNDAAAEDAARLTEEADGSCT